MLNEPDDVLPPLAGLGYSFTGPAFTLRADGRTFTSGSMTEMGHSAWRVGDVEVRLVVSPGADGSHDIVLEATGVRRVEEVCLLDHDIEPTPSQIHNYRWFDVMDMQQSTAVFLRDEDGGVFASWANPFGRAEVTDGHLRLWYRPAMDVTDGTFRSDPLVVGRWARTRREVRFDALPGRDIAAGKEPSYLGMIAPERPVVFDAGEVAAMRASVTARIPWEPQRTHVAHWDWGQNTYRLDPAEPETQAIYERIAQFCGEIGVETLLISPGVIPLSNASTEGPWQHIMWLAMGNDVGHGRWQPGNEPSGMRELLASADKHGVGVAAYVNPQFPWLRNQEWRVVPPPGEPEKYGHADIACLAVPAARDWLIAQLREFIGAYELAGVSLDFVFWYPCHATDHPHEPGADSQYAQWDGYRRLLAALRENQDLWVETLIGSSNVLPWGSRDMTHTGPYACDNQPQWVPAWPDLSQDRTYAHYQRRTAWWHRNLAFTPSYKVPGGIGHQANRMHDLPVERGWDWMGARFNLLAGIATGPSSLSLCFLPGWDEAEWAAVRERDGDFFARWIEFAKQHAEVLSRLVDLYDEPRPGAVDGTIALDDDGLGFAFLINPDFTDRPAEVPLPEGRLLRELYPEPGRLWDGTVTVESHEVHVLEVIDESDVAFPALLGAAGAADLDGAPVRATGRPGSVARVETRLADGTSVPSVIVYDEDGVSASVGPWLSGENPVVLATVEGDVQLHADWRPGAALPDLLASLTPPVEPVDEQLLQPWSDPSRLRLFIELADPASASVTATVDGETVPVQQAYVGTWADVKDTEIFPTEHNLMGHYLDLTDKLRAAAATGELDTQWRIDLSLTGVAKESFGGMHVAHLPRRTTDAFTVVDLLGSPTLEAATNLPSEAPLLGDITLGELLKLHAWRGNPGGATLEHGVVYGRGGDQDLTLSVYRRNNPSERRPAVVFVHGGGWAGGDAYFHDRHAQALAAEGYVTANIDYRLYPVAASWRDGLADVKCAVRWLRAHADQLGVDPDRIAIAGGSAGAHLAAMVAMTPGEFEGDGGWAELASGAQAAVLLYPGLDLDVLYDIAPPIIKDVMTPYFGDERKAASPTTYVGPHTPPILTITGTADPAVPLEVVDRFHDALTKAGVANETELFDGQSHAFDLISEELWQESTDKMIDFLGEHL